MKQRPGGERFSGDQARFLGCVLLNPRNRLILECGAQLGLTDWWLTGGAVFQTVWNAIEGCEPTAGIRDYDLFYFDADDLSAESERLAQDRAVALLADPDLPIEVHNEARVHLWYEAEFGVKAQPFTSTRDAIDHFVAPTCCFAVSVDEHGELQVYAPYGYDDLFNQRLRPNPILAPREVYERKCARWLEQWPALTVEPWAA